MSKAEMKPKLSTSKKEFFALKSMTFFFSNYYFSVSLHHTPER